MTGRQLSVVVGIALVMATAVSWLVWNAALDQDEAPDEATRRVQIEAGQTLYAQQCASCHGAKLEGQANWKQRMANGRLPAPPHDVTGHTWHHTDQQLFAITRDGLGQFAGEGYQTDMPKFAGILTDDEIRAVIAFIKSTWPERERLAQERLSKQVDQQ